MKPKINTLTSTFNQYYALGLCIRSALALPWCCCDKSISPDVVIACGDIPESLIDPVVQDARGRQATFDQFLEPELGYGYYIENGCKILFDPALKKQDESIQEFFAITALRQLLQQRGKIGLHASGIAINGKAFIFMGSSGSGKSTLAMALKLMGYNLLCDDICLIDHSYGNRPKVIPYCPRIHLKADSFEHYHLESDQFARLSKGDGFYMSQSPTDMRPVPLHGIFHIQTGKVKEITITKLNHINALRELYNHSSLCTGPVDPNVKIEIRRKLFFLSQSTRLFKVVRPKDHCTIDSLPHFIETVMEQDNA